MTIEDYEVYEDTGDYEVSEDEMRYRLAESGYRMMRRPKGSAEYWVMFAEPMTMAQIDYFWSTGFIHMNGLAVHLEPCGYDLFCVHHPFDPEAFRACLASMGVSPEQIDKMIEAYYDPLEREI